MIIPLDIKTAVSRNEAIALANLANGRHVLELGAHYGFSTVVLASTAGLVTSVDWHGGDVNAGAGDSWPEYRHNLERYDVDRRVITIKDRFERALPMLLERGEEFEGCFIDGEHEEASVARDLELVLPLVVPGGWIAFHDYGGPFTGVTKIADLFFARNDSRQVVDTLAWGIR